MGLSVVGVLMISGSLSLVDIVHGQQASTWYILFQPIGFIIFVVAAVAETNRAPFDLARGRVRTGRRLPTPSTPG